LVNSLLDIQSTNANQNVTITDLRAEIVPLRRSHTSHELYIGTLEGELGAKRIYCPFVHDQSAVAPSTLLDGAVYALGWNGRHSWL
jgi:hypothetical protein